MIACAGTAAAQQSSAPPDSVSRAEIRTALRAFYYNRVHGNSNALLVDMLGSKVDANRTAPFEAIVASDTTPMDPHVSCMADAPIDRAIIVLKGKWAHVSVPRCGTTESTADLFRMIRLEERWRFVDFRVLEYIALNRGRISFISGSRGVASLRSRLHPDALPVAIADCRCSRNIGTVCFAHCFRSGSGPVCT